MRHWVRVAVVALLGVLVLGGCSAIATSSELGRAGYGVGGVSTSSVNGFTTVEVTASPPAGRGAQDAVAEAQRIIWQTHPGPVDRLVVAIDGTTSTADAPQLAARYGPRDPALTGPRSDPAREARSVLTATAAGIGGLGVLLAVAAAAIVAVARRRTTVSDAVRSDPTAVVGPRLAQYVVDHAVWSAPTLVVFAALFAATTNGVAWAGPLVPVWFVASVLWGWGTYAWWAARHDGRTIGMRRLELRVVDVASGGPVPLGRHTLRWLMFVVDGAALGLVGLLTATLGPLHQRLGDLVGRTVVVRDHGEPGARDQTDLTRRRER